MCPLLDVEPTEVDGDWRPVLLLADPDVVVEADALLVLVADDEVVLPGWVAAAV